MDIMKETGSYRRTCSRKKSIKKIPRAVVFWIVLQGDK
jgi:hypothetical protein